MTDRLAVAGLFVFALLLFRLSPVYQASDSHYSMLLSENLLKHGSLAMDPYFVRPLDAALYPNLNPDTGLPRSVEAINGHVYYLFPPASSILSAPFVGLMNLAGLSAADASWRYDGAGEVRIQRNLAAFLMAATAALVYGITRAFLPPGPSLAAASTFAFGSPVWSVASRGMWTHTWSVVLSTGVLFLLIHHEIRRRAMNPYGLATLLSWLFFLRPSNSVFVLCVSVYVLLLHRRLFLKLALTGSIWLGLFLWHTRMTYGAWLPSYIRSQAGQNMHFNKSFWIGIAGLLISPSRGLIIFTPVLVGAFWLLIRHRKQIPHPGLLALCLSCALLPAFVFAGYIEWFGGHCYGPRYMTDSLPWLVPPAILGLAAARRAEAGNGRPGYSRLCWGLLAAAGVFVNAPGAWSWATMRWNAVPENIQIAPERLWNWKYPQFLAWMWTQPPPPSLPDIPIPADAKPLARLDFRNREVESAVRGFWRDAEDSYRWSTSREPEMLIDLREPGRTVLRVNTGFFYNPGIMERQRWTIRLNGQPLASLMLREASPRSYAFPIPAGCWRGRNVLQFSLPDANAPGGGDNRLLGLQMQTVEVFAWPSDSAPGSEARPTVPAAPFFPQTPAVPVKSAAALGAPADAIDFRAPDAPAYITGFWPDADSQSRWSVSRRVEIRIARKDPAPSELHLTAGAFLVPGRLDRQRVRITVNGRALPEIALTEAAMREYVIPVPAHTWRGDSIVAIELPDATSPKALGLSGDDRLLSLATQRLEISASR